MNNTLLKMNSSRDSTHFLLAKLFCNSQILFVQDKFYKKKEEKGNDFVVNWKKQKKIRDIGVGKHQNLERTQSKASPQLDKFPVKNI